MSGRLGGRLLNERLSINSLTEKTVPVNADLVLIEDSELSYMRKKVQVGTLKSAAGLGDVDGPASSTDNALARWDLATGKLLQNSGVLLDDNNNMTIPATYGANLVDTGAIWSRGSFDAGSTVYLVKTAGGTTAATYETNEATGKDVYVTVVASGLTAGGFAVAIGGQTLSSSITADGTNTYYVTETATTNLTVTPTDALRITSLTITVQVMTNGTLTVDRDITLRAGQLLLPYGDVSYPAISFINNPGTGLYRSSAGTLFYAYNGVDTGVRLYSSGVVQGTKLSSSSVIDIGATDCTLIRDAANTLQLGNDAATAAAQTLKAADSTGAGIAGASLTLNGGTGGSGGAIGIVNLNSDGGNVQMGAAASAIGFYGTTPTAQQVLATGAGATVDNVITVLQNIGICKQS
jgi:hypothetical protein